MFIGVLAMAVNLEHWRLYVTAIGQQQQQLLLLLLVIVVV
jgi:hypothetical protein